MWLGKIIPMVLWKSVKEMKEEDKRRRRRRRKTEMRVVWKCNQIYLLFDSCHSRNYAESFTVIG